MKIKDQTTYAYNLGSRNGGPVCVCMCWCMCVYHTSSNEWHWIILAL